jgi:hypothetical protein
MHVVPRKKTWMIKQDGQHGILMSEYNLIKAFVEVGHIVNFFHFIAGFIASIRAPMETFLAISYCWRFRLGWKLAGSCDGHSQPILISRLLGNCMNIVISG